MKLHKTLSIVFLFTLTQLSMAFAQETSKRVQGSCDGQLLKKYPDPMFNSKKIKLCWYGDDQDNHISVRYEPETKVYRIYVDSVLVGDYDDTAINIFFGFDGNDTMGSGPGYNYIFAGNGKNTISSGPENHMTYIYGGMDRDIVYARNSHIYTFDGKDLIVDRGGGNFIDAGPGRDTLNLLNDANSRERNRIYSDLSQEKPDHMQGYDPNTDQLLTNYNPKVLPYAEILPRNSDGLSQTISTQ